MFLSHKTVGGGDCVLLFAQDAMELKARDRLPAALCWSMVGITTFLMAFGAGGYLAYGAHVSPFITVVSVSRHTIDAVFSSESPLGNSLNPRKNEWFSLKSWIRKCEVQVHSAWVSRCRKD